MPGQPAYTGNFQDGFGNRLTVHAVANRQQTYREPSLIYDRSRGYRMVTFNKQERTMNIECWPRYVEILTKNPKGSTWPITIKQQDNYGRKAAAFLDELKIEGVKNPVIELINEANNETEYVLRLKATAFGLMCFLKVRIRLKLANQKRENLRL